MKNHGIEHKHETYHGSDVSTDTLIDECLDKLYEDDTRELTEEIVHGLTFGKIIHVLHLAQQDITRLEDQVYSINNE